MSEPGLKLRSEPIGEPLISEVSMIFEPLTFQESLMQTKEFQKGVAELLGDGAILSPRYSENDVRKLAESLAAKGKQVDQKSLAGLTPRGVRILPAGQMKRDGRVVTVNKVTMGDMGLDCIVAGTSDDARTVLEGLATILGRLSGGNQGWKHYQAKLSHVQYGTATVSQFKLPLRSLLSDKANDFLAHVEKDLAKSMVPERPGVPPRPPAFAKVMVHEIGAYVTVVEEDGTTLQCTLKLSHETSSDIATKRLHVVSQLDYAAHIRLVEALGGAFSDAGTA